MEYKNYIDIDLDNDQRKSFDIELKHYLNLDKKDQTFKFKKYKDGDSLINWFKDFVSKKGNKDNRDYDKKSRMTTIKNIHPEHFRKLEKTIDDILEVTIFDFLADDVFEEYNVMVCDHENGITSFNKGYMIIPLWALEKGDEYFKYYVCHELSHAIIGILEINDRTEAGDSHGVEFYNIFKTITPKNLWKYEVDHFPTYKKYLRQSKVMNFEDYFEDF